MCHAVPWCQAKELEQKRKQEEQARLEKERKELEAKREKERLQREAEERKRQHHGRIVGDGTFGTQIKFDQMMTFQPLTIEAVSRKFTSSLLISIEAGSPKPKKYDPLLFW